MSMEAETEQKTILEKILTTRTAHKAQDLMRSKFGVGLLAAISFVESLLPVPIITDPFLAAAIMVNRARTRSLIVITLVSSVLGGFFAYLIAVFFREFLLSVLTPDMLATLQSFVAGEEQDTFILTIVGAITPIPYTVVAWAVALTEGNPLVFILGSVIGRAFRYGVVGWCTVKFGSAALAYAKRSILVSSVIIFVCAGLYIWLKM